MTEKEKSQVIDINLQLDNIYSQIKILSNELSSIKFRLKIMSNMIDEISVLELPLSNRTKMDIKLSKFDSLSDMIKAGKKEVIKKITDTRKGNISDQTLKEVINEISDFFESMKNK